MAKIATYIISGIIKGHQCGATTFGTAQDSSSMYLALGIKSQYIPGAFLYSDPSSPPHSKSISEQGTTLKRVI